MYYLSVLFQFYIAITIVIATIVMLPSEPNDNGLWAVKFGLAWPGFVLLIIWVLIIGIYFETRQLIGNVLKGN